MRAAYYNEIDPFAAQWLRNLIAAGHIAPGDVDERSIVDVRADDLRGYDQCHFFAGTPLVDGVSFKLGSGSAFAGKSRVGMLRAAGNAIVPQVAAEFIGVAMEVIYAAAP